MPPLHKFTSIRPLTDTHWSLLTPHDIFAALRDEPTLFWLDSGNLPNGWSFLGIHPSFCSTPAALLDTPLHRSRRSLKNHPIGGTLPPYKGGWIVHLNYPTPFMSAFPRAAIRTEIQAHFFENVLAYSHIDKSWHCIVSTLANTSVRGRRQKTEKLLRLCQNAHSTGDIPNSIPEFKNGIPSHNHSLVGAERERYLRSIRRALHYICAGDIYQVNIAHCFDLPWSKSAGELYLRLRSESSAAYGVYLGSALSRENHSLLSISPELFLRNRNGIVTTRPIKGTRALGASAEETLQRGRELETSPKERAELNMIVDLERNDLGRVCSFGSIRVESSGEIEELPALLHRTATVSGRLRRERRWENCCARHTPADQSPARQNFARWRSSQNSNPSHVAPIAARLAGWDWTATWNSTSLSAQQSAILKRARRVITQDPA